MSDIAGEIGPEDPVSRIMTPSIASVDAQDSLLTVAQELTAGDIGAVLVLVPGDSVGMISERDIVTIVGTGGDPSAIQAGDIMAGDLVIAEPTESVASVGRLMLDAGVRHIPIREGNTFVGLVSIRDVLTVLVPAG